MCVDENRNNSLIFALIFETCLGIILVYVPWLNPLFGTAFLDLKHLLPSIPFALLLFVYDELRKWELRRHPNGS